MYFSCLNRNTCAQDNVFTGAQDSLTKHNSCNVSFYVHGSILFAFPGVVPNLHCDSGWMWYYLLAEEREHQATGAEKHRQADHGGSVVGIWKGRDAFMNG